jgi:hypothetical protein
VRSDEEVVGIRRPKVSANGGRYFQVDVLVAGFTGSRGASVAAAPLANKFLPRAKISEHLL